LASYADGLRVELAGLGYTAGSAENHVRLLAQLSRWLVVEGLDAGQLSSARVGQFLDSRRTGQRKRVPTERSLVPLLGYLRKAQVVPAATVRVPDTPVEVLLSAYRAYLFDERGLAARTVRRYEDAARRFLLERAAACGGDRGVEGLTGAEVSAFLLRQCERLGRGSARGCVAELRSLLRFLGVRGLTGAGLAAAVPAVAGWGESVLPATVPAGDVSAMLASCQRDAPTGCRDFAILTLLARLGLRAGEVAGLELGDIDWRAGEIVIRGKGRRADRLPLPGDVGEALVAYLRQARPATACRKVFVTRRAPLRSLHPNTVSRVVRCACLRAGLVPVRAHRLRHALATELLAQGSPLAEIGQVLRHRDLATTAAYARVDRIALRSVAQPWPGATR
jgi:site-specific recombinase XerD